MSTPIEPVPEPHGYEVTLPCSPEDFRDFIGGLLGKPQTSDLRLRGSYEIDLTTITNLHHLIDQRIHQQNNAHLVQFTAKITYSDSSSVQLGDFDELVRFQEVHPKISVGISLSWIYLITFQRKVVPEKQQIDISFQETRDLYLASEILTRRRPFDINVCVSYTERTWGHDLQSLLAGHLDGLIKPVSPLRRWIARHSSNIGLVSGSAFMFGSVAGVLHASETLIKSQLANTAKLFATPAASLTQLAERVDYLISITGQGVWPRFTFAAVGLLLLALALSVAAGLLVATLSELRHRGFILLTDAARLHRDEAIASDKREWIVKIGSLLASLAGGVVSNIIYSKYFASL